MLSWSRYLLPKNNHVRHLMFDLDKTLWNMTVEWKTDLNIKADAITYVPPAFVEAMVYLSSHYTLHVCSRSSMPEQCYQLLETAYPSVHFQSITIYPTVEETKYNHVKSALGSAAHSTPFYFFDDEITILRGIQRDFPLAIPVHGPNGFLSGTVLRSTDIQN